MSQIATEPVVITFDQVSKVFETANAEVPAMESVSFTVRRNEFTTVVGPSGCGKTTLLRLIAGLTPPTTGRAIYKGLEIGGLNTGVGYVTQDSNLFPWLTMEENVEFPLKMRGVPKEERRLKVREWVHLVGLDGFEKAYPYQLSGGMQKRASIIRAMIYDPDVMLMDEPFGALDAQTRMLLQDSLLNIWSRDQKTILFITHDLTEAIALSDTVVLMTKRPGTVKDVFRIPLARPRNIFEIHSQDGFAESYAHLWRHFQTEIGVTATAHG